MDGRSEPERPPRRRLPQASPLLFARLSLASLIAVCVIVLTGAAVRLTGSGLGCPDWPTCYHQRITPQLSFHPLVEFSNRLVTVVLTVLLVALLLAALRRRPFRRDLAWLSAALLGGVVVQAVIGAIAVYTKLNPYVVVLHLLASMVLVGTAVVLLHRSRRLYEPGGGTALVGRPIRRALAAVLALLGVVLAAGTFTTGAGPHAGNAQGQLVARRIPIALRDMAELHSTLAILLVGLSLGVVVALHATPTPERIRRAGRIFCFTLALQAAVGYTQYFTHLPAGLVEVHVLGATVLVVGAVQFFLSTSDRPRAQLVRTPASVTSALGEPERQRIGAGGLLG